MQQYSYRAWLDRTTLILHRIGCTFFFGSKADFALGLFFNAQQVVKRFKNHLKPVVGLALSFIKFFAEFLADKQHLPHTYKGTHNKYAHFDGAR